MIYANKPSSEQQFYQGKITSIKEENSSIDGEDVLYSISFDTGATLGVTEHSKFFRITDNFDADETLQFTQMREEVDVKDLTAGDYAEVWARHANTHLIEVYDLTVKPD